MVRQNFKVSAAQAARLNPHGGAGHQGDTTSNTNASILTRLSTSSKLSVGYRPGPPVAAHQRNQPRLGPRVRPGHRTQFGGTQLVPINEVEQLNASFGELNVSNVVAIDPSEAPGRSTFGADWRSPTHLTTQMSMPAQTQWVRTSTCIRSPFTRRKFKRGQVISLPFHQPNLAEDVDPSDPLLTLTRFGPVYTKRLMAVVLRRYKNEMMCLPIYSWGGRGIEIKPEFLWDQYMEITNSGPQATNAEMKGAYRVLSARMNRPMSKKGCVCLAAGFRVDFHEDLLVVGSLEEEGT